MRACLRAFVPACARARRCFGVHMSPFLWLSLCAILCSCLPTSCFRTPASMQVPLPTMPAGWLDTGVRCEREAEPGILPRFHLQERHPAGAIPGVSPSFFLLPYACLDARLFCVIAWKSGNTCQDILTRIGQTNWKISGLIVLPVLADRCNTGMSRDVFDS